MPDLIEKIISAGIATETNDTQAKRVKAMMSHLKPIMRECKREVNICIILAPFLLFPFFQFFNFFFRFFHFFSNF